MNEINGVYQQFAPRDIIHQRGWLFSASVPDPEGQQLTDWTAREEKLSKQRRQAIADLLPCGEFSCIQRLAHEAEKPFLVGVSFAQEISSISDLDDVLKKMLEQDEPAAREFIQGLVAAAHCRFGGTWANDLLREARTHKWDCSWVVQVLLSLPSEMQTWEAAESFGNAVKSQYWKSALFWPRDSSDQEILYGIEQLLGAGRARVAVDLIGGSQRKLPSEVITRMLTQAAVEPWPHQENHNEAVTFQFAVCQLLRRLDADPNTSESQIAQLEWMYLALLEYSERPAVVLHRFMAREPAFFVEVLSAIFRPHLEGADTQEVSDETKAIASQAYRLIESWKVMPGESGATLDALALHTWVKNAHDLAHQAKRGRIGDSYIGRALSFSKVDIDGAWPERGVRDVIEEMRNEDIENGVILGAHNSRGVTHRGVFDGGALERGVSKQYRDWADLMKFEWPRTASLLQRIAASFDENAEFHDQRAEFNDWAF